jgi:hypothetical protein
MGAKAMSNLSRRHLVATTAALPALALPAAAATLAYEPDPIFAAIREYIAADKAYGEAIRHYGEAEVAFREEFGRMSPDGVSKELRTAWATAVPELERASLPSHEAIDKFVEVCNVAQDVTDFLHEELDLQRAAHDERVIPKQEDSERAGGEAWAARESMLTTQPTTLAGLAALLRVSRENATLRFAIDDDPKPLLKALSTAAERLAREAVRS